MSLLTVCLTWAGPLRVPEMFYVSTAPRSSTKVLLDQGKVIARFNGGTALGALASSGHNQV